MKDIFLLHTVPMIISDISLEMRKNFPDSRVSNVLDELLLTLCSEKTTDNAKKRLKAIIEAIRVEDCTIVVTCSSLSKIAKELDSSIVLIDENMLVEAAKFNKILVVATTETTILPTTTTIKDYNKDIEIDVAFVENAMSLYKGGDKQKHDECVLKAINESVSKNKYDAIVLAQASMAHLREPIMRNTGYDDVLTNVSMMIKKLRKENSNV